MAENLKSIDFEDDIMESNHLLHKLMFLISYMLIYVHNHKIKKLTQHITSSPVVIIDKTNLQCSYT